MARQGQPRERTTRNIQAFWEAEAAELGGTPRATIRDVCFRIHELHTLVALIPKARHLLDAGCGTGFGTLVLARRASRTTGTDSSGRMIEWAKRLQSDPSHRDRVAREFCPFWGLPETEPNEVEFVHGDVLTMHLDSAPFDVVTAQRLLINLPSHEEQMAGLRALRHQASDGAFLILGETTEQGYRRTDTYRAEFGLPPLERHWHNLYLDEDRFVDWSGAGWRVEGVLGFDTYTLFSKVVYPAACGPENCTFLSAANVAAMEVASVFRSRAAAAELGDEALFARYVERAGHYDPLLGDKLGGWLDGNRARLPDWAALGNQKIILARTV